MFRASIINKVSGCKSPDALKSGSIAANTQISATKNKSMKATSLGIWYVQIPSGIVVNPIGVVVQPKTHKGSRYVVVNRKIKAVSKLPHLDYSDAMNFKEIFCQ